MATRGGIADGSSHLRIEAKGEAFMFPRKFYGHDIVKTDVFVDMNKVLAKEIRWNLKVSCSWIMSWIVHALTSLHNTVNDIVYEIKYL